MPARRGHVDRRIGLGSRVRQRPAPLALRPPSEERVAGHMAIDAATRASLELLVTQRGQEKGSLRSEIDRFLSSIRAA